MMGKKLFVLGFSIIVIVGFLSGCQESQSGTAPFEGIMLESDIVELSDASLDYIYNNEKKVVMVEVHFLLHNIAGRDLKNLQIYCDFYDSENNLIIRQGPKTITTMPIDYIEQESTGFNEFSYDEYDAELVERAVISVIER